MSEAILGVLVVAAAFAGAIFVIHTLARQSAPAADGAADPMLGEPDRDAGSGSREFAPLPDPNVWQSVTVSDLSAAEKLLDWAEAEGYQERELVVLDNSTFLVRWRGRA